MALAPAPAPSQAGVNDDKKPTARELTKDQASREIVFGIVGHVGSGTSTVAESLLKVLTEHDVDGGSYECQLITARKVIEEYADQIGHGYPNEKPFTIEDVKVFQNLGDAMRAGGDHAAVARGAILKIRELRAEMQKIEVVAEEPVVPDGKPRAYIIDSIRHPAEVELLRRVYSDAFVLIGVVCEEKVRKDRISNKYRDAGLDAAEKFMKRDAKAEEKHGQRVSDAFHLSDFFLDNTEDEFIEGDKTRSNDNWDINDHLDRLIRLVSHNDIERPKVDETAMYSAAGAAMKSACLSRQVGAAILDPSGNIVATGANEVPKAGGGVYGDVPGNDDRCFVHNKYCSNTKEQTTIAEEIFQEISGALRDDSKDVVQILKSGRVGELLEFSRAVHAEMDALLSAGRKGISTVGCKVYVTTFPCHYCARHIVSAGIDEVQFIEPYPKSKAFDLHKDSILNSLPTGDGADGVIKLPSEGGTKVVFRPFTGVAPRMFRRAFQKDRQLKDKETGEMKIQPPEWGSPYDISKSSYADFEVSLTRDFGK